MAAEVLLLLLLLVLLLMLLLLLLLLLLLMLSLLLLMLPPVAVQLAMQMMMVPTCEVMLQPCHAYWALPSIQPKHGMKKAAGFRFCSRRVRGVTHLRHKQTQLREIETVGRFGVTDDVETLLLLLLLLLLRGRDLSAHFVLHGARSGDIFSGSQAEVCGRKVAIAGDSGD
jgi:hypothetical protein